MFDHVTCKPDLAVVPQHAGCLIQCGKSMFSRGLCGLFEELTVWYSALSQNAECTGIEAGEEQVRMGDPNSWVAADVVATAATSPRDEPGDGSDEDGADLGAIRRFRDRRLAKLETVESQVECLQQEQRQLRNEIEACNTLLGESLAADPPASEVAEQHIGSNSQSPEITESVEAAISVLRRDGPLHYRRLYDRVTEMGITVVGKDPAAVLLSRFSRDPRLARVGSGTYAAFDG